MAKHSTSDPAPDKSAVHRVKIGLYRCSQDGALVLVLEQGEGGGTRITGHKPVRLDLVQTFMCNFTDADLTAAQKEKP